MTSGISDSIILQNLYSESNEGHKLDMQNRKVGHAKQEGWTCGIKKVRHVESTGLVSGASKTP